MGAVLPDEDPNATSEAERHMNPILTEISMQCQIVEDFRDCQITALLLTRNRRFFVTQNRYIGLGPKSIRVGDQVYIVSGAKVPFIFHQKLE